jgi:hypothetical protein
LDLEDYRSAFNLLSYTKEEEEEDEWMVHRCSSQCDFLSCPKGLLVCKRYTHYHQCTQDTCDRTVMRMEGWICELTGNVYSQSYHQTIGKYRIDCSTSTDGGGDSGGGIEPMLVDSSIVAAMPGTKEEDQHFKAVPPASSSSSSSDTESTNAQKRHCNRKNLLLLQQWKREESATSSEEQHPSPAPPQDDEDTDQEEEEVEKKKKRSSNNKYKRESPSSHSSDMDIQRYRSRALKVLQEVFRLNEQGIDPVQVHQKRQLKSSSDVIKSKRKRRQLERDAAANVKQEKDEEEEEVSKKRNDFLPTQQQKEGMADICMNTWSRVTTTQSYRQENSGKYTFDYHCLVVLYEMVKGISVFTSSSMNHVVVIVPKNEVAARCLHTKKDLFQAQQQQQQQQQQHRQGQKWTNPQFTNTSRLFKLFIKELYPNS